MTEAPLIERIELSLFEITVENMQADPSGFGISYTPGQNGKQLRLATPASSVNMCRVEAGRG
jgi:hypothetical protein